MRRRISVRTLWLYLRRGLLLYGASVGGSMHCYQESLREQAELQREAQEIDPDAVHWDWSVPHVWYDMAHRD